MRLLVGHFSRSFIISRNKQFYHQSFICHYRTVLLFVVVVAVFLCAHSLWWYTHIMWTCALLNEILSQYVYKSHSCRSDHKYSTFCEWYWCHTTLLVSQHICQRVRAHGNENDSSKHRSTTALIFYFGRARAIATKTINYIEMQWMPSSLLSCRFMQFSV